MRGVYHAADSVLEDGASTESIQLESRTKSSVCLPWSFRAGCVVCSYPSGAICHQRRGCISGKLWHALTTLPQALGVVQRLGGQSKAPPSDGQRIFAGLSAGAASALVMTPTDAVMITQQKHGGTFPTTLNRITSTFGYLGLYRGLSMCIVRESTFTCCYIALVPLVRREISIRNTDMPIAVCATAAALGSALVSCLINHPADTLKTRIQGSMFSTGEGLHKSEPTVRAAAAAVCAECNRSVLHTVSAIYRGLLPRLFRITCCSMIYDAIKNGLEDIAIESNKCNVRC